LKTLLPILCIVLLWACNAPQKSEPTQQEDEYLLLQENPSNPEESGYVNSKGEAVIPFGKYPMHFTDTFKTIAIVIKDGKLTAINRKDEALYEVFNYDNGPDYISEGLSRMIKEGKVGFVNREGEIVIQPKYECQWPFNEGLAIFCENGRIEKMGEYDVWKDAKWGAINKKGEVVIKAIYDNQFEFENGIAEVQEGDKTFKINTKGEKIK